MIKVAFHNLGCKVNAYELEAVMQQFAEAGYLLVPFEDEADIYIVNTCTVTNMADRKSRQMLHRAKKRNPQAIVVAVGCYVQTAPEAVLADAGVDLAVGNDRKSKLLELLEEFLAAKRDGTPGIPKNQIVDMNQQREYEDMTMTTVTEHSRAFVKVEDGCNQFCSYCIIPYARGRVRSRRPEAVVEEIRRLAENGIREVVLTGIHLSSYGVDFVPQERRRNDIPFYGEPGLLELIRMVHAVPGIERIRLGSLEPRIITEEFASGLAKLTKLCPHFHLSLQSGCDATLQRMNRRYTAWEYREKCEILRRYFDHPAITTDVIVGFPGETDEEFAQTEKFLQEIGFYEMHIFKYSRRQGTRADRMPEQVAEPVKTLRSNRLISLADEMSTAYRRSFLGSAQEILTEETVMLSGRTYTVGYTREYIKAAVPGEHPANELLRGRLETEIVPGVWLLQPDLE